MSHVSDGFFAFPPSFPHQQRILQFSLALFVSCDKILSKQTVKNSPGSKRGCSGMENLTRRSVPISILPGIFFPCTPKSHMTI